MSYFILSWFSAAMLLILCYSIYRLSYINTPATFADSSIIRAYKSLSVDTNGNGKKDTVNISIDEKNSQYIIEITNDDKKKFLLSAEPGIKSMGPYVNWWPLRITIADINMDGINEIMMQLPGTSPSVPSYIFRWDGKQYCRILWGLWSGISLADVNGDRIPEVIISERIPGSGEKSSVYTWILDSYSKVNVHLSSSHGGYEKIRHVMDMINSPFEEKLPSFEYLSEYFTEEWLRDTKGLKYLVNFSKDIVGIQLQDYISHEIKAGDGGSPDTVEWRLRYMVFRKFGTEVRVENYMAEVMIEKIQKAGAVYLIKDIKFKGL